MPLTTAPGADPRPGRARQQRRKFQRQPCFDQAAFDFAGVFRRRSRRIFLGFLRRIQRIVRQNVDGNVTHSPMFLCQTQSTPPDICTTTDKLFYTSRHEKYTNAHSRLPLWWSREATRSARKGKNADKPNLSV